MELTIIAFILLGIMVYLYYLSFKRDLNQLYLMASFGGFSAFMDFLVEFRGTKAGYWSYSSSVFKILGLVPIELPLMFFALGTIICFAGMNSLKPDLENNSEYKEMELTITHHVLFLLSVISFIGYFFFQLGLTANVFAIPIGLLGYELTKEEDRQRGILFATSVACVEIVFELWALSTQSYHYSARFFLDIPWEYFLLALGGFGLANFIYFEIFETNRRNKTSQKKDSTNECS